MELLDQPGVLAVVLGIVFFAGIVQSGLGMGFGLTAAPLVALLDPELVPAPVLILGFFSSAWVALRHRAEIVWPEVGLASLGRLIGVGLSMVLLIGFSRDAFTIAFAVLVILAVAMSLAGLRIPFTPGTLVGVSVLSGVMGTITSVGAPPLALIYQGRAPGPSRATLAAFFAIGVAGGRAGGGGGGGGGGAGAGVGGGGGPAGGVFRGWCGGGAGGAGGGGLVRRA